MKRLTAAAVAAGLAFSVFAELGVAPAYALPTRDTVQQPDKVEDHYAFYGIDVSVWQGTINWNKVKADGADYAFIRAGATKQNSFEFITDSTYEANMKNAEKAGVARGVYWYSQATTVEEAEAEAEEVCKLAKGKNLELPIVMDMEFSNGRLDSAYASWVSEGGSSNAREQLTEIADAFLNYCREQGYETCLYVSLSLTSKTSGVDAEKLIEDGHELWLAQYNESNSSSDDYTYWQYSSIDYIDGIRNRIDSDYMYVPKDADTAGHSNVKAALEYDEVEYTGDPVEPAVKVTDELDELTEGEDYTVLYMRNIAKGTGYAVIKGKGDYSGYFECLPFKIGKENVETEEEAEEPSNVVTTEVDGNTVVKFDAPNGNVAGTYRISYRDSDDEEWQSVDTVRTEYTIPGTPSQIRVSAVDQDEIVATAEPDNDQKTDIIDDTVKDDTSLSSSGMSASEKVKMIDKEVSRDVTTSGSETD